MFLLAIDGGGTKTLARLTNTVSGQQWQQQAGASSINNDMTAAVRHIRSLIEDLCKEAAVSPAQLFCVMGLAGAGNPQLKQQFTELLKLDFAGLQITNDGRTSLYGANLGKPVVAVALGTGSVGMRLDADLSEHQYGGWGFNIGDEGGGAWLGKQAVQQLLREYDSPAGIHSSLAQKLSLQLGQERPAILQWLKTAVAADYAALSPLIFQLAPDCTQATKLLQLHKTAVIELIEFSRAGTSLPVVLLGGLAEATRKLLDDYYLPWLRDAKGNALDGATLLARQLAQEKK